MGKTRIGLAALILSSFQKAYYAYYVYHVLSYKINILQSAGPGHTPQLHPKATLSKLPKLCISVLSLTWGGS